MTINRVLLLDLENVLGPIRPPSAGLLRARVSALLAAAGDVHHAVAGYALSADEDDPIASMLAELRIAPLRTSPGPNAVEHVLLSHAHRLRTEQRCHDFAVSSADRAFAELAEFGRIELVVFVGMFCVPPVGDVEAIRLLFEALGFQPLLP